MTKKLEPVTVDTLREIITDGLNREAVRITIHAAVADVLKKFVGKPITKRALTALRLAHPSWEVTEREIVGMLNYRVRSGDSGLPEVECFVGYRKFGSTDLADYDPAAFEVRDAPNGRAAIARNAKRAALLNDSARLADIERAINRKIAADAVYSAVVVEGDHNNPDVYAMRRLAGDTA